MWTTLLEFVGETVKAHVIENVMDAGVQRLGAKSLSDRLRAATAEWASGLAQSGVAETLIQVLFAQPFKEAGPERLKLRGLFAKCELPDAEVWFAALYERWNEVRTSGPDLQPFFELEPDEAAESLRELAETLDRVSRTDPNLFSVTMIGEIRAIAEAVARIEESTHGSTEVSEAEVAEQLWRASSALLRYPSTLTEQAHFLARPELETLLQKIASSDWSATILLGERGSGKSALLSRLAQAALDQGCVILGVKADVLPASLTADGFARSLGLDLPVGDALRRVAAERRVIVVIDQIDAVAEIADRQSDRLNILLDVVHRVSMMRNVHVVVSSREFEFRTDARLTSLLLEHVSLALPPFDAAIPLLVEAGHAPAKFGEVLRDLLRNPLALKIFLEVARPDEQFSSLAALLNRLWSIHVTGASDGAARIALLDRIVDLMTRGEQLAVPLSVGDVMPEALQGLCAAGLLLIDGPSLTFRHQAFYEFGLARRFGSGRADLSAHVRERQDGLFVRPTILATLGLLRETSAREYDRVVTDLMTSEDVRPHVRALVVDFLGSQREPLQSEAELLLPLLSDNKAGVRMLGAAVGSPGWFEILRRDERFARWLDDRDLATRCLRVLVAAMPFDREGSLSLVREHWLADPVFDDLTAHVLRELESLDETTYSLAATIVERSPSVDWLVEHWSDGDPRYTARLVGVDLDRRISAALERLGDEEDPRIIRGIFEDLLTEDHRHEFLMEIATKRPLEFICATWHRFVDIAGLVCRDRNGRGIGYSRSLTVEYDRSPLPNPPLLLALRAAARHFAAAWPGPFVEFVKKMAAWELSVVHDVLAEGLVAAAPTHPGDILEYLLADRRRLALGSNPEFVGTSAQLIGAVHPHLAPEGRRRLEEAIETFRYYEPLAGDSLQDRAKFAQWNRRHRYGLLSALDRSMVPPELAKHIAGEERFFGDLTVLRGVRCSFVGSPMKKEEIVKAKDGALLNLMNQVTDATPSRRFPPRADLERSGGAEELAREIGDALAASPERGLRLLEHLEPGKHQSYARAIAEAIVKGERDLDVVAEVLEQLDQRGFASDDFRASVSWALHERASHGGLPDRLIAVLTNWLTAMPPGGQNTSEIVREPRREPIVAGYHAVFGWPQRANVIAGLSAGLLDRPTPAVERWISTVRREIGHETALRFWEVVLGRMATPLNELNAEANVLLGDIFATHPALLEEASVLMLLGQWARGLTPERLAACLTELRRIGSPTTEQGWGELVLCQERVSGVDEAAIAETLASDRIDAIFGLAYGAAFVWGLSDRRGIAEKILLAVVARGGDEFVDPVSRFLRNADSLDLLDAPTERVVRCILENEALAAKLPAELLTLIEARATQHPALAERIVAVLLAVGATRLVKPSEAFFGHAGELTTLALTLHRQPQAAYRAAGLGLFERLIELNVHDAEAALELLDRRAARRYVPSSQRRLRRRLRNLSPQMV